MIDDAEPMRKASNKKVASGFIMVRTSVLRWMETTRTGVRMSTRMF